MGSMSLDIPAVGDPGTAYASRNSAALATIEEHDHTTGKGAKVPSAGLDINAQLEIASQFVNAIGALIMGTKTTAEVAALVRALYVNSSDDNLYWKDVTGFANRLTGQFTKDVPLRGLSVGGSWAVDVGGEWTTAAADNLLIPLDLRVGDRVDEIRVSVSQKASTSTFTAAFERYLKTNTGTTPDFTASATKTTSGAGDVAIAAINHTVLQDSRYHIRLNVAAAELHGIGAIEMDYSLRAA